MFLFMSKRHRGRTDGGRHTHRGPQAVLPLLGRLGQHGVDGRWAVFPRVAPDAPPHLAAGLLLLQKALVVV